MKKILDNPETSATRLRNLLVFALMMLLAYAPVSQAARGLSLGVTMNGSSWEGDNGSGNTNFESDRGGQFAASINYRVNKFYTGLNLQGGTYDFGSDAPSQFTSRFALTSDDVKVEHSDFDLLFGYYFWSNVSLFVDLKVAHSEWRDTGYEQAFSGLGFGVSGFHPIDDKWVLFGSFGFVNGDLDDDDKTSSHGDGSSSALVGGAVYRIDPANTVNFGLKLRSYEFDFDDGNEQKYTLNGLFIGYNHTFDLN